MGKLIVQCIRDRDWRCRAGSIFGLVLLIAVVVYGRIVMSSAPTPTRLVVYAFSTQEEVLTQSIFPAFEEAWRVRTGQNLTIEGVFGPSETLAGQINLGAPADVALFSNAQNMTHLKVGRRVCVDNQPVAVSHTPMVIVTRPGNPWAISDFFDLAQPGLQLLHADPRTSGAGQWAVLAEYGSALSQADDQQVAQTQLEAIWHNVRLLGASARATLTLFELGAGDAFVTYEHDALLAQERGVLLEIVVPPRTIVAQHIAVIVDDNVTPAELTVAQAFVEYLLSDAGQQAFSYYHLRPADPQGEQFPEILQPFTVEDLGDWSRAYIQVLETIWQTEIEPHLDLEPTPTMLGTGE
ncbi:MAG: extracellular solute-binding protein [Anaerolineae bacterium]